MSKEVLDDLDKKIRACTQQVEDEKKTYTRKVITSFGWMVAASTVITIAAVLAIRSK